MLEIKSSFNLKEVFEQYFRIEIKEKIENKKNLIFTINGLKIRDMTSFFKERGGNLVNISILEFGESYQLIYEFHFKLYKRKKFLFLISKLENTSSINSLDHIFPQAKYYENEIEKRYGLKFKSTEEKVIKEVFTIPNSFKLTNKSRYLIPLGIYNKNDNLKHYFNLFLKKSQITTIKEKTGWLYRGIIPLLTTNTFRQNLDLTKKICYPSSYHHNLAYIMALEQLFEIQSQNRVNNVRTIFCEFERFESLLSWFINLFHLLKNNKLSKRLHEIRAKFHQSIEEHLKIQFFDDINFIGYCKDFSNGDLLALQLALNDLSRKTIDMIRKSVYSNNIKEKCEGKGILERDDALHAGVTGCCLRASGIDHDIRFEKPYLSYMDKDLIGEWAIVTSRNGDVFSRIETRAWEIEHSIKIVDKLISKLIDDDNEIEIIDDKNLALPKEKIAIMQVESPQGELGYYLKTSDSGDPANLAGACICSPSLKNFMALNEFILKGSYKSDFPLIVHSMDLIFNEIDL